jgi:hypothetical protein
LGKKFSSTFPINLIPTLALLTLAMFSSHLHCSLYLAAATNVRKIGAAVLRIVYFLISECVNTSHGKTVVIPIIQILSFL